MLAKFKPYLVTGAVVVGTLIVLKILKPKLPAFFQNLLP